MSIEVRNPLKLYDLCLHAALWYLKDIKCLCERCGTATRSLPNTTLVAFYEKLFLAKRLCLLAQEYKDLETFNRLLTVKSRRPFMISSFQWILNHDEDLISTLLHQFEHYLCSCNTRKSDLNMIEMGLRIGSFLNDGGWYEFSIKFLEIAELVLWKKYDACVLARDKNILLQFTECYRLKLYAQSMYCQFPRAMTTFEQAQAFLKLIEAETDCNSLLTGMYCCFSVYYFAMSNFNESYKWAIKALELLPKGVTNKTMLDVLRQASKACVAKQRLLQARLLIRQAMNLGKKINSPTLPDVLADYGFFLLNSDLVPESVIVYHKVLCERKRVFESNNIHIALAHEDLAYSLYVREYSSGDFNKAKDHAEISIKIMEKVLPKEHLLLASVKRVKALILEEIALDENGNDEGSHNRWLDVAEELHITAWRLSQSAFGEKNVQTAKHYGNLGRLYQSMNRLEEAEKMHLKAIEIKEELLGPNDYEVGLSIGHLASLYNYHMKKYSAAEDLYLRSIEINLKIFGPSYSGLEYDYRGLLHIYEKLAKPLKFHYWSTKLREWKVLREKRKCLDVDLILEDNPPDKIDLLEPKEILKNFHEFEEQQQQLKENGAKLANEFPPYTLIDSDELD
ncbi:unnamed protein product [Ceutorhynchus assimilis]|uniref:Amyloid protein-binding protein 2 n=1 Tax=Ceutorhynchus assimilis TaxID=467358 RepID=A0A9N9MYZ8_9CUCU|nr:unnamed protein product [Ceutorhynchus assimilis]